MKIFTYKKGSNQYRKVRKSYLLEAVSAFALTFYVGSILIAGKGFAVDADTKFLQSLSFGTQPALVIAAEPQIHGTFIKVVTYKNDDRVKAVHTYLKSKKSVLANNAEDFVRVADENAIDWTLMVSISGKESSFGKHLANDYNPFGITTGKKTGPRFRAFESFKEAIEAEGKLLGNHYRINANTAIGHKYCPIIECSETWAEDVTEFSKQLVSLTK